MPGVARDRGRPLKVFVSATERATIEAAAVATGLPVSAYLRNVGLGYAPPSRYDRDAVDQLAQVNGDLGRLGGLLKLWLRDHKPGRAADVRAIELVMDEIAEDRRRLRALMARV